jgi:hypothetical protein
MQQQTDQNTVTARNARTLLLKEVICIRFDQNLPQGENTTEDKSQKKTSEEVASQKWSL